MDSIMFPRNEALDVNPPAGDSHLSTGGSSWLWAVFAIHLAVLFAVVALSLRPRGSERIFHYLFGVALLVGAISYFAMASDLAFSVVATHLHRGDALTYQIFFAKYIYWVVAFPAIIIALGLLSGVSWATIVLNVFMSWIWVISYLCSAYTPSRYKWGFYALGTFAYIGLALQTLLLPHKRGYTNRASVTKHHSGLAGWANLLWLMYPIAFAVSDGGNVIGVTGMAIFFGILDILLVPVLALVFLMLAKRWDHGLLGLHYTQHGRTEHGRTGHNNGAPFTEKGTQPSSAPGAAPGAAPYPTATPAGTTAV